jgi:hypothetical protein
VTEANEERLFEVIRESRRAQKKLGEDNAEQSGTLLYTNAESSYMTAQAIAAGAYALTEAIEELAAAVRLTAPE